MIQEPQEKKKKKKKRKKASDIIAIIVMIVAIGVFLYAAIQLFGIFSEYKEGSDEYDSLREYVQVVETEEEAKTTAEVIAANEIPQCPINVDFQSLKSINSDIVGWIYIEAIPTISYPIVQGTDNEYYLKHTVEGVLNSSASIFMDYRNASDFSDSNTIIYGHNMKNQSMFGILSKLKEQEVYDKSPYIWIITEEGEICYEVFAARNVPDTDALYNLLNAEPETFKTNLESYKRYSEVDNDITFDGTEKIITLSTCTSNERVRCVIQAVRRDF